MGVIENDLTMLDAYMQKANEYIEVPLPRNYPSLARMPLKLEQAFTPRRSSKPCERAMIGWPTESIPVSPLEISDSSRSFESVICPGGQTSSRWLEQQGIEAEDELVAHLFEVAKSQKRNMLDEEIHAAVAAFGSFVIKRLLPLRSPSHLRLVLNRSTPNQPLHSTPPSSEISLISCSSRHTRSS